VEPLKVGLIGAGIFAREAHLPAWQALGDRARIVSVWSRTMEHASELVQSIPGASVALSVEEMLASPDIDAVDVVLPIDVQPAVVAEALAAGKHVVSEKPVAEDTAKGKQAIEAWRASGRQWMVAENYRYASVYERAAEIVQAGTIGEPVTAAWALHVAMTPDNKYYNTPWRRTGRIPGGYLLDGGVHHVAALRLILGDVMAVHAFMRQVRPDLPPADTLSATIEFASGALGSYVSSFAAGAPWEQPLQIVGTKGSLRIDRGWIEQTVGDTTERIEVSERDGVERELAAFVAAVLDGTPHRNTPEQALADLAVIEAMLDSGLEGGLRVKGLRW
jgi:predicted dehydrogenase